MFPFNPIEKDPKKKKKRDFDVPYTCWSPNQLKFYQILGIQLRPDPAFRLSFGAPGLMS